MAEDFDIEAYLEAQVETKGATKKEDDPKLAEKGRSDKGVSKEDKDRKDKKSSKDKDRERRDDRDRRRSSSRDRDRRRGNRSRSRSRERESRYERPKEVKRETEAEREEKERARQARDAELLAKREADREKKLINDLTKDQRTVFVSQLTMKVNEKMIREFFSQIGDVNDVIMIRDKFTGRHKGFAYVEMADLEKIPTCLMLNACVPDFQKFPILVKASEAEKNFLAKKEASASASTAAESGLLQGADSRVYLGNLHVNITEEDLKTVLSQFGTVESINIQRDEVGTSRGYAFARYSKPDEAQSAFSKLAGLELAGKAIKVGFVNDSSSSTSSSSHNAQNATGNWKLDDDEGAGMQMNAQSRVMLMAKLGQAAGITIPVNPMAMSMSMSSLPNITTTSIAETAKAPPVSGIPSRYFLIRNMFVLAEETGDNWDEDIKEDVADECKRFGTVEQVLVDKFKPGGIVHVKFSTVESATNAANSLNGRWFAGRMITATFLDATQYASIT